MHLGVFVNADDIEKEMLLNGSFNAAPFGITVSGNELYRVFKAGISESKKLVISEEQVVVIGNRIAIKNEKVNSYLAADIAQYIRMKLLESGISFAFETVFSHQSKLNFMALAKSMGYKVYLYFMATEGADINISRVENRVAKQGHHVDGATIAKRYTRTLELLYDAVRLSNRAYLFDNSGVYTELVCEVTEGKRVQMYDVDKSPPEWFIHFFYNKAKSN